MTTSDPFRRTSGRTARPTNHGVDDRRDRFNAFFASQYPPTVRLAHLLTGSNSSAEDLAQDAFARVFPKMDRLDNPAAYLRTTTVNVCNNWHRSTIREADRFRRHGVSDPESTLQSDELLASIRKLPYRQQAVLVMRYWLDLTEAEIASTLECRPGTVKSLNARALVALGHDLDKDPS